MKTIEISTDVFARIWALREDGESSEDAVLRRLLWSKTENRNVPSASSAITDLRFGVTFPEGFEVFRSYLGRRYRARVQGGAWLLDGRAESFGSLNELSRAIGAKTENAWQNWLFAAEGSARAVAILRDPRRVNKRDRGSKTSPTPAEDNELNQTRWVDDVASALKELGGQAPLQSIYEAVERIRRAKGRSLPRTLDATVRRTIEDHSSDSGNWRRGANLFHAPEGIGVGIWALGAGKL